MLYEQTLTLKFPSIAPLAIHP